jgi:hypothetical protein
VFTRYWASPWNWLALANLVLYSYTFAARVQLYQRLERTLEAAAADGFVDLFQLADAMYWVQATPQPSTTRPLPPHARRRRSALPPASRQETTPKDASARRQNLLAINSLLMLSCLFRFLRLSPKLGLLSSTLALASTDLAWSSTIDITQGASGYGLQGTQLTHQVPDKSTSAMHRFSTLFFVIFMAFATAFHLSYGVEVAQHSIASHRIRPARAMLCYAVLCHGGGRVQVDGRLDLHAYVRAARCLLVRRPD